MTGLFQQKFTNQHYQVGLTEHSPFAAFGYALSAANLLAKSNNFRFFGMTVTELMSSKNRNFLKPATLAANYKSTMNASERLVEIYYRQKKCFTVSDVKIEGGNNRQFDLLAFDVKSNKHYHIESSIGHGVQWSPTLDNIYHLMNYKFFGAPKNSRPDNPKTDFAKGKSYHGSIKKAYETFGLEYKDVVRVWCTWCLTKVDEERIIPWKKEMAKIFQLKPQNFELLSFRDTVLPFIMNEVGTSNYDDDLSRCLSLIKAYNNQTKIKK